jgi:hypothetical protein
MKAGITDPENTSIAEQRHRKHVSAVTNNYPTPGELMEALFSMRSVPKLCKKN